MSSDVDKLESSIQDIINSDVSKVEESPMKIVSVCKPEDVVMTVSPWIGSLVLFILPSSLL